MKIFHIIEEASTCGQQIIEVHAENTEKALAVYFQFSQAEAAKPTATTNGNVTIYDFGEETCTITKVDECRMFAKWTHKMGLY